MGAVGSPGTRMGMTPGMHSSHLGAYESRPGVWVWGDMPSDAGGDAGSLGPMGPAGSMGDYMSGPMAGSEYGISGHPGSLGSMLGLPADFGKDGFGLLGALGAALGGGGGSSGGSGVGGMADGDVEGMGEFE